MNHPEWQCKDCKVDTQLEYYMVHDELWEEYGCDLGVLCVGCLENRMNRQLTPADFTDYPVNSVTGWKKSDRLISRIKGE